MGNFTGTVPGTMCTIRRGQKGMMMQQLNMKYYKSDFRSCENLLYACSTIIDPILE